MSETTNTEVAVHRGGALAVGADQTEWTEQQLAVLRSVGVSEDVTAAELTAFLHESQRTGLDPFSKQIYLIGRRDKKAGRDIFRSQTGIDGYRVVAHRAARRDGVSLSYTDTLWCGPDGVWRDVWLAQQPPAAAKVTVFRGGEPFPAVATLSEYAARYPSGDPYPMWAKMPATMLAKCAEALALRKAFPHDLSGIYTAEEMEQADARDARPQELTVDQAAAKMRRDKGKQADDEWATDPAQGRHEPTNGQLQQLAMRVTDKFGITDRPARLVVLSELLGRQLASMRELSYEDAEGLLGKLHQLPDHIADAEYTEGEPEPVGTAPNPRNGDNRPPLDPALFVPPLRQLVDDAAIEPGLSVYDALRKMISEARTEATLKRLFQVATEAVHADEISAADFARLDAMGQEKNGELTGPARPQSSDAPDEAQYEVRDRLAGRIKAARAPEQFTDVYGALVEARDAGTITQIQHDALVIALDDRYKTVSGEAGPQQSDQGWSHRRMDQMAGAAQS